MSERKERPTSGYGANTKQKRRLNIQVLDGASHFADGQTGINARAL